MEASIDLGRERSALEILRSAGFDPQQASEIARSTLWTGIMLVMSEAGYHPELSPDERAEWQRRIAEAPHEGKVVIAHRFFDDLLRQRRERLVDHPASLDPTGWDIDGGVRCV